MKAWRSLPRFATLLGIAGLLLMIPAACQAFSVLAHQAVVDQAWDTTLLPLLRKRFPNATQQDLDDARGYARGGSHLPDLGYFPLGSHLSGIGAAHPDGSFVLSVCAKADDSIVLTYTDSAPHPSVPSSPARHDLF